MNTTVFKACWPKNSAALLLSVFCLVAFQNCSPVDFSKVQKVEIASLPPEEKLICGSHEFVQPNEPKTDQLDLLFVIDTSGSLNDERPLIAQEIDSFLQALSPEIKVNISVTLAHGSTSEWTGRLYQVDANDPPVLSSALLNADELRTGLQSKLANVVIDANADQGEEGLYSLNRLINGAEYDQARLQGFFRDQAALSIVFIGDEADICAVDANGVPLAMTSGPGGGVDAEEMAAFNLDCNGVTPEAIYDRLKFLKPDLPLILSSIAYLDAADGEVGNGYIETVDLDDGIKADLANNMFNVDLQRIGLLASERLALIDRFSIYDRVQELEMPELDWESMSVSVDGQEVDYQADEAEWLIQLTELGSPDSVVRAEFCSKTFFVDPETGEIVD